MWRKKTMCEFNEKCMASNIVLRANGLMESARWKVAVSNKIIKTLMTSAHDYTPGN